MHGTLYETECKETESDNPNSPFFADWEQRPKHGKSRPSKHIPRFLTHGTIVEHMSGKCLTAKEVLSVHGWGTLRDDCYASDIVDIIAESCASNRTSMKNTVRTFVGNSMHIPSVLAVMLYGFSHVQRMATVDERARYLSLRSASIFMEIGAASSGSGLQSSSQTEFTPKAKAKATAKSKVKGRGRGQKRKAFDDCNDDDDDDDDQAASLMFRRAKSNIFYWGLRFASAIWECSLQCACSAVRQCVLPFCGPSSFDLSAE